VRGMHVCSYLRIVSRMRMFIFGILKGCIFKVDFLSNYAMTCTIHHKSSSGLFAGYVYDSGGLFSIIRILLSHSLRTNID
jgi:hypothetical protein